ncbi:MAG: alpha/beta hydrolase-fold protein [Bacteroidetes bacterium]|nr:alpha/beta hydrolase-fold protein [Bacteroidota bacterium]
MRKTILAFILLLTVSWSEAQDFQHFIDRINALPMGERQAVADSFITACPAFPFIENDSVAHFIYTGSVSSVTMAGDATQWNPNQDLSMIQGTTFWYLTKIYEADARLDYKLVTGGSNWILDPRNPNTCLGGFGPNSELRMGGNTKPPETIYDPNIPHGTIKDTTFHSAILDNTRALKVYLPPSYSSTAAEYPVILFHDGPEYISLGAANNVLDYLIAHKMINPVIAVFVPPLDRQPEYAGTKIDLFTSFITTELMPFIDLRYRTSKDPMKRATLGASDGGNIALYLGVKKPQCFGRIAAQSSDVITAIDSALRYGSKLNLDFYLDIGTYDIAILIPMVHSLATLLQSKGYSYSFREIHEGHSWGNWKEHLRLPLMQFFPFTNGIDENFRENNIRIDQNRPNPFRGDTDIFFSVPPGSRVHIDLCDYSGRILESIFSGTVQEAKNSIRFSSKNHKAGNYLCMLEVEGHRTSRIVTIID